MPIPLHWVVYRHKVRWQWITCCRRAFRAWRLYSNSKRRRPVNVDFRACRLHWKKRLQAKRILKRHVKQRFRRRRASMAKWMFHLWYIDLMESKARWCVYRWCVYGEPIVPPNRLQTVVENNKQKHNLHKHRHVVCSHLFRFPQRMKFGRFRFSRGVGVFAIIKNTTTATATTATTRPITNTKTTNEFRAWNA